MSKPPVGVVIVNWNLKDSLRETLKSFRKVNYPGLQVVVSDNASTDGSQEMVRAEFPEVVLLTRDEGVGYARGASIGLEYLLDKAKYIFSTTNDVEVDPEIINRLVDFAEQRPEAGVIGTKILFFDRPHKIWHAGGIINPLHGHPRHRGWECRDQPRYDQVCECDFVTGCGVLLRSEALAKVGCFKADLVFYAEDAELCYRMKEHGYRIMYLPTARMWHKVETTLAKNRSVQLQYCTRNSLYLIKRHRVGWFPLSLWVYLLGACPAKMLFFALCFRWANVRGIWRGFLDWRADRYGWIK